MDSETEVLTKNGWKSYSEVSIGDEVYSIDTDTGYLCSDKIYSITANRRYSGDVYSLQGKGVSMRVTDRHHVLFVTKKGKYRRETADVAFKRQRLDILKSGRFNSKGINMSDNILKLYIALVADGHITNSRLCRFLLKKLRKIKKVEELLNSLGIEYTKNHNANETVVINFKLPAHLDGWKIKGLDVRIVDASREQCGIIKETYRWTDGNRNLIFTSKRSEVDLLQHMFVINGYSCKVHFRDGHGYSTNRSYQLSVVDQTKQMMTNIKSRVKLCNVDDELFWRIQCSMGNLIVRRKGSVFVIGN